MSLITQTIQLFEHPPKNYVFQAFKHPHHFNIRTPTPCELQQGLPNVYQPLTVSVELQCGLPNVFQHTKDIFERLLDYYSRFQMSTRLLLSLWNSNGGCQTCTSLQQSLQSLNGGRERLLAFDSLLTGLVVIYVVCLCELCYYRTSFQTIPLIV